MDSAPEGAPRARVLQVELDGATAAVAAALSEAGHTVEKAGAADAERRLEAGGVDLVLLEAEPEAPVLAGILDTARRAAEREAFIPVLVVAADAAARVRLLKSGADECVLASVPPDELVARVEALLRIRSIQLRMRRSRQDLQRFATTDALTGLQSRRHFLDRSKEELRRARRYHEPLSLILFDLDGFRGLNLELGEKVGDQVLKDTARLLQDAVREVDLVGRLGGDTFGVLLPSTHLSGGLTVAERVWRAVGDLRAGDEGRRLGCSAGLAFFPSREVVTHEDLLRLAQEALFRAKEEGRNRICLYQAAHYSYDPEGDEG